MTKEKMYKVLMTTLCVMAFLLFPMTVFSASSDYYYSYNGTEVSDGSFSGSWDKITRYYDSNGVVYDTNISEDYCTWSLEGGHFSISAPGEIPNDTRWRSSVVGFTSSVVSASVSGNNVPDSLLSGCTNLKSVALSGGLKGIGSSAFSGCSNLPSIILGSGLKTIGSGAFYGCSSLEELVLPEGVETYGSSMLNGCTKLKRLTLGGTACPALYCEAFGIGKDAQLEAVTIREGVTDIGERVFSNPSGTGYDGLRNLKEVSLPESLETIGDRAFISAEQLESINIPAAVTEIGSYAFYGCHSATPEFPEENALKTIGQCAFYDCGSMEEIYLPSVETIGSSAFSGCSSMPSITLGGRLQEIGSRAFANCSSLSDVFYAGSESMYSLVTNHGSNAPLNNATITYGLKFELILPENLTTIESEAFSGTAAEVIIIPEKCTDIEVGAFGNCPKLQYIVNKSDVSFTIPEGVEVLHR